jgi:hypothetical protein
MTIILTILITLLASQLLPASAGAWITANRQTTITLLAAAALLTGLLTITTAGSGEAPITARLLQQAAQAAEADGGGYDYTCQLYGAPRQIACQGQGPSVNYLVTNSGQLQPEPGTGQ